LNAKLKKLDRWNMRTIANNPEPSRWVLYKDDTEALVVLPTGTFWRVELATGRSKQIKMTFELV
jgi:hypothetical protein